MLRNSEGKLAVVSCQNIDVLSRRIFEKMLHVTRRRCTRTFGIAAGDVRDVRTNPASIDKYSSIFETTRLFGRSDDTIDIKHCLAHTSPNNV
jgi:hypothetical protein